MFKKIASYRPVTIITCALSLLNVLFYFSMRCLWSGIGKVLKGLQAIPNGMMILFILVAAAVWIFAWRRKERLPMYILLVLSVVLDVVIAVIFFMGGSDYLWFVLREFGDALLFALGFLAAVWIIFFYPVSPAAGNRALHYAVPALLAFIGLWYALGFGINRLDLEPVVYAVEDEYQIVFTTTTDAAVRIDAGGSSWYDLYAGSQKSEGKLHKVCVPMEVLDAARSYRVHIQQILMRGPYGGFKGREKTYSYSFRPVDTSDGFDYYVLADIHGKRKAGIRAASYLGDRLDALFILGDTASYLQKKCDIELTGKVAFAATGGEVPVVYARGNHETKGLLADQLYRYVGSRNEQFYFTFRLGPVWGVVLDGGEDHFDDWWEYYGLAHFEPYRAEQTTFLQELVEKKPWEVEGVRLKMALCHFVIPYVNDEGFMAGDKESWTDLLNRIGVDVHYAGHEHEIFPVLPGNFTPGVTLRYDNPAYTTRESENEGYFTDPAFPSFVVSRHDDVQNISRKQSQLDGRLCGTANHGDPDFRELTVSWINRHYEKMEIVDPFSSREYGTEVTVTLPAGTSGIR